MAVEQERARRAGRRTAAATSLRAEDPRLRGRTYAIPFDRVWTEALALASGGLRGWSLVEADDQDGVIRADARRLVRRSVDHIVVRVGLDEDAQTRVDAESVSTEVRFDLGTHARRIGRFFRALDRRLGVRGTG